MAGGCGGCHNTGVDLKTQKFVETSVGCEACHGKGSWHAALPKTAVFEKRQTIVNPAKLNVGDSGANLRLLPQSWHGRPKTRKPSGRSGSSPAKP